MKRNIVFVAVCIVLIGFAVGCSNLNPSREKSEFEITYAAELSAARSLLQDRRSKYVFDNAVANISDRSNLRYGLHEQYLFMGSAGFPRYFHPLVTVSEGDTVIDGGSLRGDVSMKFSKKVGANGRVIVFEPDPAAVKANLKRFKKYEVKNIEVYPLALWNVNCTMIFYFEEGVYGRGTLFGYASPLTTMEVETITIDYFVKTRDIEKVNFIKLHIEGAEMQALKGAENILRMHKPNLAIAIYHEPRHLFEMILWLNSLELGYKFWMDEHDIGQRVNLYAMSALRVN
ncbi:MAG: FkbM family methyltransferase [Elusimicrobia bacterium]|nr:FkbM family methyltransferase [Elusimicrobiota bacterium]